MTTHPNGFLTSAAARPRATLWGHQWPEWVGLLARLILGGTLLAAGLLKVGNLGQNVISVRAYQLFDLTWQRVIGYSLPVIEIIVGLLLIAGLFTRVVSAVSIAMMLAFIIGISSAWARGLSLDCGCFGSGGEVDPSQTSYPLEIARDLGLMVCGLWLLLRPRTAAAADRWLFGPTLDTTYTDTFDASDNDEDR